MDVGRYIRTIRHLTPEQIAFTFVRGLRHETWRRFPARARAVLTAAAAALPAPGPAWPRLTAIAELTMRLQKAVHTEPAADLRAGRFAFLGRSLSFEGLGSIDWRRDLGEENSPLRRLTLAYFGWAVPLLMDGRADDVAAVAAAVASLDAVPWTGRGVFRDLWNPYTASHRLINLLAALNIHHRRHGGVDESAARTILAHVRLCAALIQADAERDLQANHLFKNWTALAAYAAATASPAGVFPFLEGRVRRALDQLILRDGGHAERSPMYHALGLLDVETLAASEAVPALSGRLSAAKTQMRRALDVLSHPDGDIALFNDSWLGGAPPAAALQSPPAPGPHALAESGYVRLDGGRDVVIFDCGKCGLDLNPGHAHADFLSLEASVAGVRFLVDPGTPTYTAGPLRDRCRSASAHNGPAVDGREPMEFWKSFRVGRRANAGGLTAPHLDMAPLWCAGWQDGYSAAGIGVRRWVGFWPGKALAIVDLWSGVDPALCRSRFTVPDPWHPVSRPATGFTGPVSVETRMLVGRDEGAQSAAWWPRYGTESPAVTFDIRPALVEDRVASAVLFVWDQPPSITATGLERLIASLAHAQTIAPRGFGT